MPEPTLTPLEAHERCQREDNFVHGAHRYVLDGPMGCPPELLAPMAINRHDATETWFVSGEHGDPIDGESKWIKF